MKFLLSIILVLTVAAATIVAQDVIETKTIEQRLNNFDVQDNRRWQMRYMENRRYLQSGGPMFILVGGEYEITEIFLQPGVLHMYDMARDLNGTLLFTEHRYFGNSRPTPTASTSDLRWLSIDQTLADLANFIVQIKQTRPELTNSGVFLVSGGYGGSLAMWFLKKYPHLADGAWNTGGPIEYVVDFKKYLEAASDMFEEIGGRNCSRRVERAFEELEELIEEGDYTEIERVFRFCQPLDWSKKSEVSYFINQLIVPISTAVKTYTVQNQNVQNQCNQLLSSGLSDIEALSMLINGVTPNDPSEVCTTYSYANYIASLSESNWSNIPFSDLFRQLTYLTCTQIGVFQTTSKGDILFGSGVPVEYFYKICSDVFGSSFTPKFIKNGVDRTNRQFGGRNINVKYVYNTQGQFDPWNPIGAKKDLNRFSPTAILPNESHCSDIFAIRPFDSPTTRASKERVFSLAKQWMNITP